MCIDFHIPIIISADPPIYVIIVPCIVGTVLVLPVLVIPSILFTYVCSKKCKKRKYTCTKGGKLLKYNSVNKLLLVGDKPRHPSPESGIPHVSL